MDTDQIIPAVYLKRVTRTGFEDGLFAAWREHPDFVLNNPLYAGASILIAGSEFGTGSSREHAVWALSDYGFRVIISPRYGDIFRGNSLKQGLLTVELPQEAVEVLWDLVESRPTTTVEVDLSALEVRADGRVWPFALDNFSRWRLLEGLDDIGLTLRHAEAISSFEAHRPSYGVVVS